jgi:hypothetical protein
MTTVSPPTEELTVPQSTARVPQFWGRAQPRDMLCGPLPRSYALRFLRFPFSHLRAFFLRTVSQPVLGGVAFGFASHLHSALSKTFVVAVRYSSTVIERTAIARVAAWMTFENVSIVTPGCAEFKVS